MARPSKALENTNRHNTKAEIEQRKAAEKASMTGILLRESVEVANDAVAHTEFERVSGLLSAVGKNDALFEAVVNDYCAYKSDIARYVAMRDTIQADIDEIIDANMDTQARYKLKSTMYGQIMDCDKQIQTFQKKRFDIEKENGFTISSALRSIPKAPAKKSNPLLEALGNGTS